MTLHVISTPFWGECNVGKQWILKWCSYFGGQRNRITVSQKARSIHTRCFGKSGASSNPSKPKSQWNNKNNLCFCSLYHCHKELQLVVGNTACCLVIDLLSDRTIPFPVLWCWREPHETARKRGLFLLSGKSPKYLVPAHFVPQTSWRISVLWSLVSCLPYFVDQHYLCLVSSRQVQVELRCCSSGLVLCCPFHVYWCTFWELTVFPHPQNSIFKEYFPCWFLDVQCLHVLHVMGMRELL